MFATSSDHRLSDQDLNAFVDGELDTQRYRQVVQQLATDPGAAERLSGFLRQHGELAQLREHLDQVELDGGSVTAELGRQLAGTMRRHRRLRLCSGAVGVLISGLVASWTAWGPDPSLVAQRIALATSGSPQMLFGRDPFSGAQLVTSEAGDGIVVDQQLAAYSIQRPDFAAHGFSFIGGGALQGGSSPAIRLVYKDEADRLVYLFVGTVGGDADVALTLVPEGHVSLNWRRGPLVFALIGPKESQQLLELMQSTGESLPPVPTVRPDHPTSDAVDATQVLAPAAEGVPTAAGIPTEAQSELATATESTGELAPAAPLPAVLPATSDHGAKAL